MQHRRICAFQILEMVGVTSLVNTSGTRPLAVMEGFIVDKDNQPTFTVKVNPEVEKALRADLQQFRAR